jgi:outer membrane scaffolding protein for murein synthesis (MipA/OmpV family)
MKNATLFLICMAFLATIVALASFASAQCASCEKEGDWSASASNFIEGKPTSDVQAEFGPRAVRKTESQFENVTKAAGETAAGNTNVAPSSEEASSAAELILKSINATPALVNSASAVKITAVFALNGSEQTESQTEIQLTATASIKDSSGKEVGMLSLIKASGNEYSKVWNANVPAGIYSVDIAASSLQGAGKFSSVLQIEVVGSGNGAAENATANGAAPA